jgi:hypothetical protein
MWRIVLAVSLIGAAFFGGSFALSFTSPLLIERAAREVVRVEVERRVGETIDELSGSRIAGFARRALEGSELDIARVNKAIRDEVPQKVANVVADMLKADCECRKRLVEYAERAELERLSTLSQVRETLVVLIESSYASVARDLLREFRIFAGSNAIAFILLGLITLLRPRAGLQLALPAVVLVGAVTITAGLYLFNQDWLHTIVFGQYVGFAYAAYLAFVALLLADVVFNRARVTTRVVNWALQAVGSAATAVPC